MPAIPINMTIAAPDAGEAMLSFLEVFPNITTDPGTWSGAPLTDAEWMVHKVRDWLETIISKGRRRKDLKDNYAPPTPKSFVS